MSKLKFCSTTNKDFINEINGTIIRFVIHFNVININYIKRYFNKNVIEILFVVFFFCYVGVKKIAQLPIIKINKNLIWLTAPPVIRKINCKKCLKKIVINFFVHKFKIMKKKRLFLLQLIFIYNKFLNTNFYLKIFFFKIYFSRFGINKFFS